MLGVTPRHGRRAIAIIASAWLLIAGVLGLRHEAQVAHVLDGHGVAIHGARALGHTAGAADHLHAGGGAHADDACALAIALHQPGATGVGVALAATPIVHRALAAPPAASIVRASIARYRLAPKTSPPIA